MKFLKSIFANFLKRRGAIGCAREHLRSIKGNDHLSMATVIANTDDGMIVRLCHGHSKPPTRVYFVVADRCVIRELQFEDVRKFCERPWL